MGQIDQTVFTATVNAAFPGQTVFLRHSDGEEHIAGFVVAELDVEICWRPNSQRPWYVSIVHSNQRVSGEAEASDLRWTFICALRNLRNDALTEIAELTSSVATLTRLDEQISRDLKVSP